MKLSRTELRNLRDRWDDATLATVRATLCKWAFKRPNQRVELDATSLADSLDICGNSYVDLRGISLVAQLNCYAVSRICFDAATFEGFGQFGGYSTFDDCLFRQTKFNTNLHSQFTHCSFANSNLRDAKLGMARSSTLISRSPISPTSQRSNPHSQTATLPGAISNPHTLPVAPSRTACSMTIPLVVARFIALNSWAVPQIAIG